MRKDVTRLPDPGTDSDFDPETDHRSDSDEESNRVVPTDTEPPSFRTIPCVPCLKRMVKVPLNGHPEPCTDRTGGHYTACKLCAVKSLGCKSPGDYVEQPLKQWNDDDRGEFVMEFTRWARKVQSAAKKMVVNEKVADKWEELTAKVQEFIDEVGVEKAKQEAHEAKKKYEALREETDQIWARLKEVEDWIEMKAETFLSKDEDDNMFVRFMASAIILEKKDRKKFQETLDYVRGVGNDGTSDDNALDEEEEEQQESSEEESEDEDVHMVSA
ncbi:hypothetical protein FBULB1_2181 [Fusarium bulbicola]|nr:hypothetical protein FBULB1_2181 [Fusarium bulbicola]